MKRTVTIAGKDFKSMIVSPIFMIMAGFMTLILSFTFLRSLMQFTERSVMSAMQFGGDAGQNLHMTVFIGHISMTNLIFVVIIPALTMRLLAEEKKMRTYDLLLTAPVTATDIALGKFLAGLFAAGVLTLISMLYPLSLRFVSDYNVTMLISAYLGLFFVTGIYVAVGLFGSSLTESIFLSVVIGIIFNLGLWFVAQGADFFDSSKWVALMEHMALGQHFANFVRGTPKISSLVFLLSCMGFFVFLTQRVVESSRWR